ncbi:hypothetical protein M569_07786, partial [Genlisea aurea]
LASETAFNVNEVEALYELFRQLSSSILDDGLIDKEEFVLALCDGGKKNFMAEKLFDVVDEKHDGHIEFPEFVHSLNIFHPDTPQSDKISFAFKLYDVRSTGYIERNGLKKMILATLSETGSSLSDEQLDAILDRTLEEGELKEEGKMDIQEWEQMVSKCPSLIHNMTIPYLRGGITLAFPSFIIDTRVEESDLI